MGHRGLDDKGSTATDDEPWKVRKPVNYAFILFMDFTEPSDEVGEGLAYMCIRWSADDGVDHTLEIQPYSKTSKELKVGEWFGEEPFDSIEESLNSVVPTWAWTVNKRYALASPEVSW